MALSQAHQDGDIECQLVCAAHVPVPLDSDDDNNGDCRSEAASESSHFTALSYATIISTCQAGLSMSLA